MGLRFRDAELKKKVQKTRNIGQGRRAYKAFLKGVSTMGKKKYCRIVLSLLPCGRAEKEYIMEQIEASIDSFLSDEPGADFNAIQQRFGTPEEVAASLIENSGTAEVFLSV